MYNLMTCEKFCEIKFIGYLQYYFIYNFTASSLCQIYFRVGLMKASCGFTFECKQLMLEQKKEDQRGLWTVKGRL